jgi:hypothetical protein
MLKRVQAWTRFLRRIWGRISGAQRAPLPSLLLVLPIASLPVVLIAGLPVVLIASLPVVPIASLPVVLTTSRPDVR